MRVVVKWAKRLLLAAIVTSVVMLVTMPWDVEQHLAALFLAPPGSSPYRYVKTLEQKYSSLHAIAVDVDRGRLILSCWDGPVVADMESGRQVTSFGNRDRVPPNNGIRFDGPAGVAFDRPNQRILVADNNALAADRKPTPQERPYRAIHVFDAETFSRLRLLGEQEPSANLPPDVVYARFGALRNMAIDQGRGRLLIVERGNHVVQIRDTTTLAHIATIGESGVAGSDNGHFTDPRAVAVDEANRRIFVTDLKNFRVQVFDSETLAHVGTIGVTGVGGTDNAHFGYVEDVAVDAAAGHVLVTDAYNAWVQVFDTKTLAYVGTITTGFAYPQAVAAADGRVFISAWNLYYDGKNHIKVFQLSADKTRRQ